MEALGRLFNVLPTADDVYVSLDNAEAVTFVGVNAAGDTWTLTEATSSGGGGAQVLSTIDRYHVTATNGAVWALVTQSVGSAVTTSSSQDVVAIHVSAAELSAGYTHLKLTSTSTGTVFAILHDLKVMRKPANLAALV